MPHLRRPPGVAGFPWPKRLERTGRRFAGARRFRTGEHLQEYSVFVLRAVTNDAELEYS
jgi:hypothetical protein